MCPSEVERSVYEMVAADLAKIQPDIAQGRLIWRLWRWAVDSWMKDDFEPTPKIPMGKAAPKARASGDEPELTSERQQVEDLEDNLMDKEDEIERLGREVAALKAALGQSKRQQEAQATTISKLSASLRDQKGKLADSHISYEQLNMRNNKRAEKNSELQAEVDLLKKRLADAELIANIRSKSPMSRPPTAMLKRGISPRGSLELYREDKLDAGTEAFDREAGRKYWADEGAKCIELVTSQWMRSKAAIDAMAALTAVTKSVEEQQRILAEAVKRAQETARSSAGGVSSEECGRVLGLYTKLLDTTERGREKYIRKVLERMTLSELASELDWMEQKAICEVPPVHPVDLGQNQGSLQPISPKNRK